MRLLEREDIAGAVERIGQRIDIIGVVVQVEAGARRRIHAEQAHQRLRAMVAGTDGHAFFRGAFVSVIFLRRLDHLC